MLALALGLLGAVIVVGAFCGGVFLGCWLCGEDKTPARAGPSRPGADRKRGKRRRTFRDGYDAGYDAGYADGFSAGYDAGQIRRDAGRGGKRREIVETAGYAQTGEPVQAPDAARETVPDSGRVDAAEPGRVAVPDSGRVDMEEQAREAARRRRRLLDEQAAFRALQHYSAEHAYGLGSTGFASVGFAGRSALD